MRQTRYENIHDILRYAVFGSGPLTATGGVEGLAWVTTKFGNQSDDWPDIEFHFISGSPASDGGRTVRVAQGMSDAMWKIYEPLVTADADAITILPMLLRPKSRGKILLRSSNPLDQPIIHAGYFTHPHDMKVLVEGVKIALSLAKTKAFLRLGAQLMFKDDIPLPGCESFKLWEDDYWACMLRHYTATIYHYSGTVKMGPPHDPGSVVNHELKVYGVPRLRVIDCSIMPTIVSGNTNAPAIMIGEKGADLIKADWGGESFSQGRRRRREQSSGSRRLWPVKTSASNSSSAA